MTKMSATSKSPALLACIASPQPGLVTTTVVSAADAMSTSIWPTPTVSTRARRKFAAPSTRRASGTARESPPRWPRVAIERMNTCSLVAWSCMRMRSPRIAPPVKGELGSTHSTPTRSKGSSPSKDRAVERERDQTVGQGRLAPAGRPGDAHDVGRTRCVGERGRVELRRRRRTRRRSAVARAPCANRHAPSSNSSSGSRGITSTLLDARRRAADRCPTKSS